MENRTLDQILDSTDDYKLDRTNQMCELQCGAKIKSIVEAVQAKLLILDGSIKNLCKTKIFNFLNVHYDFIDCQYDITHFIITQQLLYGIYHITSFYIRS
jgi:hypothetical protein